MAPSTLTSAFKNLAVSSVSHLPPEVLFSVFAQLEEPVDLYQASLVSHAWRSIATDDRLWEDHYLRCYKPLTPTKATSDDERATYRYREAERRAGMIAWLKQTATSPPSTEIFEAYPERALRGLVAKQRLEKMERPANVSKKTWPEVLNLAKQKCEENIKLPEPVPASTSQILPPFLERKPSLSSSSSDKITLPKFCQLFAKRMNKDDAIMRELRSLVDLKSHRLEALTQILHEHGEASRALFGALCATQTITYVFINRFLPPQDSCDDPWPRARKIYATLDRYERDPHRTHVLALQHHALKALGHLQRQEGVRAMKSLLDRKEEFEADTLRERIMKCSEGVEEVMTSVALFRAGERSDVREYLDLLALFIFADLQAEDAAAAREGKPYGLAADPDTMPAGSTRHHLARVISSLRRLRYGVAKAPDSTDIDNAFINVVMYLPAQRLTSPLSLASIVSAVARRLGIAASIASTTSHVFLIANEDAEKPAAWQGGARSGDWKRFLVDAADDHQPRLVSKDVDFICEADAVKGYLKAQGAASNSLELLLQPASPLDVLERVSNDIMRMVKAERTSITRFVGKEKFQHQDQLIRNAALGHQLSYLRLFLECREVLPPAPLMLPTPPSSVASFDPTHVHTPRMYPVRLLEDAEYCAEWIQRIVAGTYPNKAVRKDAVASASITVARRMGDLTISGLYVCDTNLLSELDERERANQPISMLDVFRPTPAYDRYIFNVLYDDAQVGEGFGSCSGAGDEEEAWHRADPDIRHLIDRSFNPQVKYGIGTVFKHKGLGWLGAIVGWDTEWRGDEDEIESMSTSNRNQPFYKVISQCDWDAYVAQSDIEPIQVPAGSSREEADTLVHHTVLIMFEARAWGKAFNTLRLEPWDEKEKQGQGAGGKMSKKKGKKARSKGSKASGKGSEKKQEEEMEVGGRAKGQVYLVPNAWMREAWPYD